MKMKFLVLALVLLAVLATDPFASEDYEAGLLELEPGDEMFFWLTRSRANPETDPLVLWLSGGPGCGDEMAIFFENGPWNINDDLTLTKNEYSWNEVSNVLFVDQPLGSGFSSTTNPDHRAITEDDVAATFYVFLTKFLEKFPEYKERSFYITGESYAGHYIPAITAYIIEKNNSDINMVASAIGNGWVNPYLQYPIYRDFAIENDLLDGVASYLALASYWICQSLINLDFKLLAFNHCEWTTDAIVNHAGGFNVYDIREKEDYDFSNLQRLMDRSDVREAIGVDDRPFEQCSGQVFKDMRADEITIFTPHVQYALDNGVGIFVYSGDKDYICNWRGGEAWTNEIFWSKQSEFRSAQYNKWIVDDEEAGEYKQVDNFAFLRFYDAGHMVPMNQPKRSLEMYKEFLAREF